MPHPLLLTVVALGVLLRALAVAQEPSYTITLFNVPGTTYTTAVAINARGQIIGIYQDASAHTRGYVLEHGTFTTIDPPGATSSTAEGINDLGRIVGTYRDASSQLHGFLYAHSTFTAVTPPGPVFGFAGINDRNQVVGSYVGVSDRTTHGFLWEHGTVMTLDAPDATVTEPQGSNLWGQIVGWAGTTQILGFLATPTQDTPRAPLTAMPDAGGVRR
jgi:probable HAF family extracellular repeat protein